jgi:hypothetical protein
MGRTRSNPAQMHGLGPAHPKKKNKKVMPGREWPNPFGPISAHPTFLELSPAQSAGSAQPIYIYISFKKTKNSKNNFQKSFKKICDFLKYFLPILHNIRLYIYTVKYKSGIKIPGFFQNIFKKNFKTFSKISQKLLNQFPFKKNKKKCFVFMHTVKS